MYNIIKDCLKIIRTTTLPTQIFFSLQSNGMVFHKVILHTQSHMYNVNDIR